MGKKRTNVLGIFIVLFILQQFVLSVGQHEWNVSPVDGTNQKSTATARANVTITIIPKNIEATALKDGSLMSLTCQAEAPAGLPLPPSNIYWYHHRYRDNNPTNTPQLASSPPHLVSNSSNISFRIRKETVGTYECIAEIPGFPKNISKQILIPNNWTDYWDSEVIDANISWGWGSPMIILVIIVALIFISVVTAGCTFCWFRCRRIDQYQLPESELELEPGNKLAEATYDYIIQRVATIRRRITITYPVSVSIKSEDRSITKIGVLPKRNQNNDETVCSHKEFECDKEVFPSQSQFLNSSDSDIKTDNGGYERFPLVDSDCHYLGDRSNLTDLKQARLSEVDDVSNETNIEAATLTAESASEANRNELKTSFKRSSHLKHKRQHSSVKVNVKTPTVAVSFPDTEIIQNPSRSQSCASTTHVAGLVCGPQRQKIALMEFENHTDAERFTEFPPGLENRLHDHAMDQRARVYESDVFASFDREMSAKRYIFNSVDE